MKGQKILCHCRFKATLIYPGRCCLTTKPMQGLGWQAAGGGAAALPEQGLGWRRVWQPCLSQAAGAAGLGLSFFSVQSFIVSKLFLDLKKEITVLS